MSHFADLIQVVTAVELGWSIAIILFSILIYFVRDKYMSYKRDVQSDIEKHREILGKLDKAVSSSEGSVISFHNHNDRLVHLTADIEEQCRGCEQHRQEVKVMHAKLDELLNSVDRFVAESKEYRSAMRDSTEITVNKLDALTNQIIDTLMRALDLERRP
jgi:hypothetical protein